MKRKATRVITLEEKQDAKKIADAIQGAGKPLDTIELQKLVKLNGTRVNKALGYAKSLGVVEVTSENELLPRYGFDFFVTGQAKVKPKRIKKIQAKKVVKNSKSQKPKIKPPAKKAKKDTFGTMGVKSESICTVRRRDIATGRLIGGCKQPSGFVYAPDGTKARVKVIACADEGSEAFKYKVLSAQIPQELQASLRKASKEERDSFKESWYSVLEDELNAAVAAEIGNRELNREVKSKIGQRAAQTRKENRETALASGKNPRGTPDKTRAKNELEGIRAKLGLTRAEANKTKSIVKQAMLRKRISNLEIAKTQLEKIAAGKASKFPKWK